jgi:aminotransferase in exopolysaccharide biosynthesis
MSKQLNIPLSAPEIRGNEWRYLKDCLDSGWVSTAGKYVEEFEQKVAAYAGVKHAVACVNGTAALHIALIIAGIKPGDEVLVPTVTFIAPVNAVKYIGAEPVFMDCDQYLNIDMAKVADFLVQECELRSGELVNIRSGRAVKAVLPVHVFGHPVDLEPLMELAGKYGLKVIEDATESLGSYYRSGKYHGKMTGGVGDLGCLSFNGNKIMTTGGGGMILTNDQDAAHRAKYLTTQAKDDAVLYVHNEIGFNYRLTNLQAAFGLAQIEKMPEFVAKKRKNFAQYLAELKGVKGLSLLAEPEYAVSNYWFYSMLVDQAAFGLDNLGLMQALSRQGIQSRPLWRLNHQQQPYVNNQAYKIEQAQLYHQTVLNLPCSVGLKTDQITKIVEVIKGYAKK